MSRLQFSVIGIVNLSDHLQKRASFARNPLTIGVVYMIGFRARVNKPYT